MISSFRIPPLYTLRTFPAGAAVRAQMRRAVAAGAEPGTILCLEREDRLDCAVLMEPDMPLARARLVVYAGALGLGDGLGAVLPAGIDVTFRWPNIVDVNVGAVGRIGLDLPEGIGEDEIPPWIALTVAAAVEPAPAGTPADPVFETNLHDEGAADATVGDLLESFARHFMVWVNRWEADGFERLRATWLRHARDRGGKVTLRTGRRRYSGLFRDIDNEGALLLETNGALRRLDLKAGVAG